MRCLPLQLVCIFDVGRKACVSLIMTMLVIAVFLVFFKYNDRVYSFPGDTTIYEFGTKEHAYGGLIWSWDFNHPKPYHDPDTSTIASWYQYLTPDPLPLTPFPTNTFTVCWNMNLRVFANVQQIFMRLFHEENNEWSGDTGDYWLQLNYSQDRGTLIMTANMMSDKAKQHIWSGGLGVGNYTTEDNPLLRWGSICIANDFENCWTRYFIGEHFIPWEPN